ncbi:UNVERIFIED_CONTAM: Dolichol-phosphate mannosyltransferase subunit 3 [Gekko kuhli]
MLAKVDRGTTNHSYDGRASKSLGGTGRTTTPKVMTNATLCRSNSDFISFPRFGAMTKLLQWLFALALLGGTWATLTLNLLGLGPLPPPVYQVLWALPTYLLVTFGCYSLGTVGYRLATFNDCEEAARELQAQIREARDDLARRGMKF